MHARPLLLLGLLLAAPGLRAADPSPSPSPVPASSLRETMRKAVEPMVDVFARSPDGSNRAVSLRLRLAEATDQPPELLGSVLAFRCQPPDQLLYQYAALGTIITVKRQGQQVWIGPASRLRPLLEESSKAAPTKADKEPLAALRLKVPKAFLWLGFRFVGVRDAGVGTIDGVSYRRIEMDPPSDYEKPETKDKNTWVRFWVRTDRSKLGRLDWQNPHSRGTLLIDEPKLSASLPAEAFQPDSTAQRDDMMEVPVPRFRQLMRLVEKEEKKRAKEQVEKQRLATEEAAR